MSNRMRHTAFLLTLAVCAGAACGSTDPSTGCEGPLQLTTSSGPTPTIDWNPDCPADELAVYEVTTGHTLWALRRAAQGITPPVTYGTVPLGITEVHAAEPLVLGTNSYALHMKFPSGTEGSWPFQP